MDKMLLAGGTFLDDCYSPFYHFLCK